MTEDVFAMNTLSLSPLFAGLTPEERLYALDFFHARERRYARGDALHRPGDVFPAFGFVLSGTVHVLSYDYNGAPMIMATVTSGETFGESLCYLRQPAWVHVRAAEDAAVLWLDPARLHADAPYVSPLDARLAERFTAMLAERTLRMNDRIQILSKVGLREKLVTYLSQCARRAASDSFSIPHSREELAVYLGVNRSALSRELSRMRAEGMIDYERNRFRVIKKLG